jgi:hypothetical protein
MLVENLHKTEDKFIGVHIFRATLGVRLYLKYENIYARKYRHTFA